MPSFPTTRLRRLRYHPTIRELVSETRISARDFILPLFIHHDDNLKNPISSMPGHYQIGLDYLDETIHEIVSLDLPGVILFGIPENKDGKGSDSYHQQGIIQQAIRRIKEIAPQLLVCTDVCFCEYTDHGHCGVITEKTGSADLDNDETLPLLAKQALSHVEAGADMVAPSGNIDGMVSIIREAFDDHGHEHIPILSYAVKYSSSLYGPFREAAEGAPKFGDRSTYQMNFQNSAESLREAALDIEEGADILMVKPAIAYLDVIYRLKERFPEIPLAAYQVSGEFAMIKAAAANGWIDEKKVALETLTAIKRAGANFIITYFAKDIARWLQDN